ncbi:MAG: endonuclease III [Candidatus Heimdallarchaeota archaeon]|nr:endonuclease III [Candidatus Heimdallarchaeota archaeon]
MAVNNINIDEVIKRICQRCRNLPSPSVTMAGKRWKSPFLVLISCIMSLRTKDETTLPASKRLFKLADTPQNMLKLTIRQIEKVIYPVGFYKTKARTIKGICQDILMKFDGQVPDEINELLTLKGVGRKTANLVVVEGFGKSGICVDTHVHRISNRFGYVNTKVPDETEQALRKKLPKKHWNRYNELLVMWGQNVCRPISPFCSKCDVNKYCQRVDVGKSR